MCLCKLWTTERRNCAGQWSSNYVQWHQLICQWSQLKIVYIILVCWCSYQCYQNLVPVYVRNLCADNDPTSLQWLRLTWFWAVRELKHFSRKMHHFHKGSLISKLVWSIFYPMWTWLCATGIKSLQIWHSISEERVSYTPWRIITANINCNSCKWFKLTVTINFGTYDLFWRFVNPFPCW